MTSEQRYEYENSNDGLRDQLATFEEHNDKLRSELGNTLIKLSRAEEEIVRYKKKLADMSLQLAIALED